MSIVNAIASVAVTDLGAAVAWYEALLGRAPDSTPMPDLAEWKFPRGGWLQVYRMPERAGHGSVTLAVTDIDDVAERVRELGIGAGERTSNPQVKTLMIRDPDGNHLAFAQALDGTLAQ